MIAYLDSSVLLRVVLRQKGTLAEWKTVTAGVTSGLTEVECLRTIDRLRHVVGISDEEMAIRREAVYRMLDEMEIVDVGPAVLSRAAQPLPTPLGTLDAIHLSTAQLWRDMRETDVVMATHDRALALAARASGFAVLGV